MIIYFMVVEHIFVLVCFICFIFLFLFVIFCYILLVLFLFVSYVSYFCSCLLHLVVLSKLLEGRKKKT